MQLETKTADRFRSLVRLLLFAPFRCASFGATILRESPRNFQVGAEEEEPNEVAPHKVAQVLPPSCLQVEAPPPSPQETRRPNQCIIFIVCAARREKALRMSKHTRGRRRHETIIIVALRRGASLSSWRVLQCAAPVSQRNSRRRRRSRRTNSINSEKRL